MVLYPVFYEYLPEQLIFFKAVELALLFVLLTKDLDVYTIRGIGAV